MPEPSIERIEQRHVKFRDVYGEASFLDGTLWTLDLGGGQHKATLPLPRDPNDTANRLTAYIEFLRFVRAEVRRLRDGAQEADDATGD